MLPHPRERGGKELDSLGGNTLHVFYIYIIPTPLDPLFGLLPDNVFNDYSIPVYINKSMRINTSTVLHAQCRVVLVNTILLLELSLY